MPRRWFFALSLALLVAALSHAATLVKLTDAELVSHGDQIILATVTGVSTSWQDPDGDGTSQIFTSITVRVEKSVKGAARAGESITFRQLGGRIGNIEYKVPGIPKFAEGDRALLFLEGSLTNPHYSPIVGLAQGRWLVRTDNDGTVYARRDFSDSTFIQVDKSRPAAEARPSEAEELLSDVLARFQEEATRQARPQAPHPTPVNQEKR